MGSYLLYVPDSCVIGQGQKYWVTCLGQECCVTDILPDVLCTDELDRHVDHPPGRWLRVVQLPECAE